ncbi:YheC/YheD family endospore coat-associated protein [Chengkuizengella axinellae]|uniref:YheC/YheD family protein n=1 Tax=Chengkuizengella axinellae TaxID=3064388 RepID=A0ABT9J053_9BACL|nr:YheC/YheD family protein [Chengkuizengella sp. 2205SS18-9]MDP5274395.1 YheC/YheD family protein [Chengkuizengella sp. 2205SS18-9]
MKNKPSLGVMTIYINSKKQFEERSYLKKLLLYGKKLGLNIFVFTPENVDVKNNKIHAYFYDQKIAKWIRKWTDIPDMIFDRCRFQGSPRFKQVQKFRNKYPDLIYLNRPLANKWIVHQKLSKNNKIKNVLPQCTLENKFDDVLKFMDQSKIAFYKPIKGTGGTGILKIKKLNDHKFLIQGRKHNRKIIPSQQVNKSQLKILCKSLNSIKTYMIQQGIDLKLDNGRVHDYRLLIQKDEAGQWNLTGCVGRMGPKGSVTSNLHGGGSALPADQLLSHWFENDQINRIKQNMEEISHEIVHEFESQGYELCELALDIAVDHSGKIWLLEVNSKPGRKAFSKIGEDKTYTKAIVKPLEYALWLYDNKNN